MNPILDSIVLTLMAIQPAITKDKASLYAPLILRSSIELGLDWRLVVSIGMQESSWIHQWKPDVGLFQINRRTASHYEIDLARIKEGDLTYEFNSFTKIMTIKLKECKRHREDAWSCYHSKTEEFRVAYLEKVAKYYAN